MKPISLQQALRWIPKATLRAPQHIALKQTVSSSVNTDTRSLRSGELFVALEGERFDAHHFIGFAARQGAAAAIVAFDSPEVANQDAGLMPLLLVPNTGKALQALAAGYRQQFQIPLVVVVGSNGKTTAKEMIHSIFKTHCALQGNDGKESNEGTAHSTQGNLNNDIGLPLTLLRIDEHHRYSTVELGMNHAGETAVLAAIAAPTIALINNAQREHQEFMQTVEAVAIEHSAVIDALVKHGTVVLPAQDNYIGVWRNCAASSDKRMIDFALHTGNDSTVAAVTGKRTDNGLSQTLSLRTPVGSVTVKLNTAGEHNARNALAATAVAIAAEIPLSSIVAGLESFSPVKGRMQQHVTTLNGKELTVVDDSYNANPDSVQAAINVLHQQAGRTVMVLGDMGEVGNQGEAFHFEAGQSAAHSNIATLYTVGTLCQHTHSAFKVSSKRCQHFADTAALNTFLLSSVSNDALQAGDTVLVKGSRFMRMELTVNALLGKVNVAEGGH